MADTNTPLGTINRWHRSTDITTLLECPGKYYLGRLFEPDAGASWFEFGTAVHLYISERLSGVEQQAALDRAAEGMEEALVALQDRYGEVRWTKKRPADQAWENLLALCDKWEAGWYDMMETCRYETIAVEQRTVVGDEDTLLATTIDAIFRQDGQYWIVDWKSGSTAKANPLQLWVYHYAARHDPNSPLWGMADDRVSMAFWHVAFNKMQVVESYPGDPYIRGLLDYATAHKERAVETGFAPFRPDWYCDYCLHQTACPVVGDAEWVEVVRALQGAPLERKAIA